MVDEIYFTQEGKKELEDRLTYLKSEKRAEVSKKIGIAREFGDLSENAEYDAAKEEQAHVEAEIEEIEHKLRYGKLIDKNKLKTDRVRAGCKVKVIDMDFEDEFEYIITGSTESDPIAGKISNESPVGKALLGTKVNDEVVVTLPNSSVVRLKVVKISI